MDRSHADAIRVEDTITLVRHLYKSGEINTASAGSLLVSLGITPLRAHSSEIYRHRVNPDEDYREWRDEAGLLWVLASGGQHHTYDDDFGDGWCWAGGYMYLPDPQPIFRRTDRPRDEAALCHVLAAAGPLKRRQ